MLGEQPTNPKPKKPAKLTWSEADATTLITEAWGLPYLTAQAAPNGGYVIGYGYAGKEVKSTSVVTEQQAAQILSKGLKAAASCYQSTVWNKYWALFTGAQNTALVSLAQSVGCPRFKSLLKNVITSTTASTGLNAIFEALITAADASATASDYLTARRAAEKELFGITPTAEI
jgi:GH24 family phage-related lysozyme (muramidase)